MKECPSRSRAQVLGVSVDAVDMEGALELVSEALHSPGCQYVCAANVHGVMESQHNEHLRDAYKNAAVTLPDGMPLAWVGRSQGFDWMQRVAGPDLMLEMFGRPQFAGLRHYLYGGNAGVAQALHARFAARFPDAKIVGSRTPPFRSLTPQEEGSLLEEIATLQADVVWVAIGCPKQEMFMARMAARMPARLMAGVGAAFDFHTGRLRDCPRYVKVAGLQWLHRLLQDPRRLWRRYLFTNSAFVWRLAVQLLRRRPTSQQSRAVAVDRKPARSHA